MDWMDEVRVKTNKGNQILFSPKDAFLQDLATLIGEQNHQTMVLWAFDFAEKAVQKLEERYPEDSSARKALATSKLWASGKVKMPVAKREILKLPCLCEKNNIIRRYCFVSCGRSSLRCCSRQWPCNGFPHI